MENTLDLDDIQGLIVKGYGYMPSAAYKLLTIQDPQAAKKWLAKITPELTTANRQKRHDFCVNLAISYFGLQALQIPQDTVNSFALEFQEHPFQDVITQHRLRILGDVGDNAPQHWEWGGVDEERQKIHLILMLFASSEAHLQEICQTVEKDFSQYGITELRHFITHQLPENKEHFGFHDGLAQPEIEGYTKEAPSDNVIKAGEFILGYKNEYDRFPESPTVSKQLDAQNILPTATNDAASKDIGKNGSYMVFRQLEQNVKGFWDFVNNAAQKLEGYTTEHLAAKIVGRWKSGAPITLAPDKDNPDLANFDSFGFYDQDFDGMKCPIGSHIRRSNPRDAFMKNKKKGIAFSRKHRFLRRGRSYGKPFVESFDVQDILKKPQDDHKRGLHFIGFNTSFGRQFEFIQQAWETNPMFLGLAQEPDPLLGSQVLAENKIEAVFSMPQCPVRQRVTNMETYIRVRGSMYFFLPSLRAIQWITTLP